MRNALVPSVIFGVLFSVVGLPRPAVADEIVITDGDVVDAFASSGIDLPGFTLIGADSRFIGVVLSGGGGTFTSGGPTNLSREVSLRTLFGNFPEQQVVHGTPYTAFVSGGLTFTATPFVMPPPSAAGTAFAFSTPFTATGHIGGWPSSNTTAPPLFSADLRGSGTATVSGVETSESTPQYNWTRVDFRFAAASAAPTPEPAPFLLLTSAGAVVLWRRAYFRFTGFWK